LNGPAAFPHVKITASAPNTLSYDTFNVRPTASATTATSFDLNLFQVDVTKALPEPASLVLMALSGLALLAVRRR
jgi:hypothetical protein